MPIHGPARAQKSPGLARALYKWVVKPSSLETAFASALAEHAPDLPQPESQHKFHPVRRWRFDAAWPDALVAVELHGGTWSGGRHTRGAGMEADCEKMNAALLLGWRVLVYTTSMLKADPAGVLGQVRAVLEKTGAAE